MGGAALGLTVLVLLLIILGGLGYALYLLFKRKNKKKAIKPALVSLVAFVFLMILYYVDVSEYNELVEQERIEQKEKEKEREKQETEEFEDWFEEEERKRQEEEEERKRQEETQPELTAEEIIASHGWRTDLTWDNLMRNPEENIGAALQFSGEIQTMQEDEDSTLYQVMMNGDVDQPMMVTVFKSNQKERFLQGDHITVYGFFVDLLEYSTVMGGNRQAPFILSEVIQLNQ